jgi:UDP-2,3-diacylglucosamine pyrophosphatase LpxH
MNPNTELAADNLNFRSIWISDVHLGTRHSQVALLLDFLRASECRYLYIVGDLIDGWELKHKWIWRDEYNLLFQKLLRKSRKQTRVIYLTGNHDEFVENFLGLRFGSVTLARQVIHVGADGRKYLVLHGHQADGIAHFNRLLERVGSRLYQWILDFNVHFNRVRRTFGFGYWSVAAYLKFKAKRAVKHVADYEETIAQMARKRKVHGVICGHIHRAEIKTIGGVQYLNCGDWVESCTALVEDFDGNMRLLHLHENPVLHSRRGTGTPDAGDRGEGDAGDGGASSDRGGRGHGARAATAGLLRIGHADAPARSADAGVCLQEQ